MRYVRGLREGKDTKSSAASVAPECIKSKQDKPEDPFSRLPKAIRHFEEWKVQVFSPARTLFLCDLHIPYHDGQALRAALRYGQMWGPERIVLNGDIADFFSVSFWEKDPRKRNLSKEIKDVRQFLEVLRKMFPKAEIIFKPGNHEERWERYLSVKAPELLGMSEFQLENVLHFEKHRIKMVGNRQPMRIGDHLHVIHGHEFERQSIGVPVNAARKFYMQGKVIAIGGHLHHTSEHVEKGMDGKVVSCWSMGCLADLHPDYAPLNKWNHGFATVEFHRDQFRVDNIKIIKGKVV